MLSFGRDFEKDLCETVPSGAKLRYANEVKFVCLRRFWLKSSFIDIQRLSKRLGQPGNDSLEPTAKLVWPWVSFLIDFLVVQYCLFVIFSFSAKVVLN